MLRLRFAQHETLCHGGSEGGGGWGGWGVEVASPIDALRVGFGSHPKKTVLNSSKLDACMAVRCN